MSQGIRFAAAVVLVLASAPGVVGQVPVKSPVAADLLPGQLAFGGPRFLLASGPHRVPVDAVRTPVLRRRLAIQLNDVSTRDALKAIAQRAGIELMYSEQIVPAGGRVTLRASEITVAGALTDVLLDTELDVVLLPAGQMGIVARAGVPKLAVDAAADSVQARTLSGIVVTDREAAVVGATVVAVGSTARTETDVEGRFRLEVPAGAEPTLRVTAIGFRPLTRVVAAGEMSLRLVLSGAAVNLNELVVTGTPLATQRRAIGNSVAQIKAPELTEAAGVTSMGQLINARVPGVVVLPGSGQVGSGPRINIRGQSSLTFPNDPLLYIDGVRIDNSAATGPSNQGGKVVSRLNDLNPADIESIEIIKGPAAATLYGTEANAGVIQIITKKGRAGQSTVDASIRQGARWFMNAEGRWPTNYWRDPAGNVIELNLVRSEKARGTPMFTTGRVQGYGLSSSGGSDLVRYYVGADYDRDEGIEPTNRGERLSGRLNVTATPHRSVELSGNFGTSLVRTKLAREDGLSVVFAGIQGNPMNMTGPTRGFSIAPPEAIWEAFDVGQDVNRFTGGVQLNHRPTGPFAQRLTVGLDLSDEQSVFLVPKLRPQVAALLPATFANGQRTNDLRSLLSSTIDYSASLQLGKLFGLRSTTSVGGQYSGRKTKLTSVTGTGFPATGLTSVAAAAVRSGSDDVIENVTIGGFVQQQIAWRDRVYLTAAIRGDDNSAFGETFNVVTYPKLSATWVVNEEPWWKFGFVNSFRLRAAYGASGKQPDTFAAIRTFAATSAADGTPTVTPQFVGNPDLKPERGVEFEAGFEASFFNQRFDLDFTYYNARVRDAIISRDIGPSTGFPAVQFVNAGEVRTTGIELMANAVLVSSKSVGWELRMNVGTNNNRIINLGIPNTPFLDRNPAAHAPGYAVGSYFLKKVVSADFDATGKAVVNVLCDGGPGQSPMPCAEAPRVFSGIPNPNVTGAVTSTVSLFSRLQIYALVDFQSGHRRWDNTVLFARCFIVRVCEENVFPERFDPVRLAYIQTGIAGLSEILATDASFAKLREVSVRYELPTRWVRPVGARRAGVTVSGRNLHTWTSYSGLDPESSRSGSNAAFAVVDQATVPQTAQVLMSINISF